MTLPLQIGVILRRYRYKNQMTQIDLAAASDSDRSFISQIENGRTNISLETFLRLCDALGVPAWDVLKEATKNGAIK